MAENQKFITGLKHFDITWMSNDNIEIDGHSLGNITIDALQFNDGIFLGKIDYPFTLVVGRYVDNVGFDMTILDAETSTLPLRVMAAKTPENSSGHFYGTINLVDLRQKNPYTGSGLISVKVTTPQKFEQESVKDVFDKIQYGTRLIYHTQPMNNALYQKLLGTNPQEHIKAIQQFQTSLNSKPLNQDFKFLDNLSFE